VSVPRPASAPKLRRGRPRSEDCHQSILSAAIQLLEVERYADVTVERIAHRAGVSKQTIYRWWSSKADLYMEACAAGAMRHVAVPSTGAFETDFRQLLELTCRALAAPGFGRAIAGLIGETHSDVQLAGGLRDTFVAARRRAAEALISRAISEGQVRSDLEVPLVIDLMFGPIWYRLLLRSAPLDAAFAAEMADHLLPMLLDSRAIATRQRRAPTRSAG
jgi:AcrR family transcriptional regulator